MVQFNPALNVHEANEVAATTQLAGIFFLVINCCFCLLFFGIFVHNKWATGALLVAMIVLIISLGLPDSGSFSLLLSILYLWVFGDSVGGKAALVSRWPPCIQPANPVAAYKGRVSITICACAGAFAGGLMATPKIGEAIKESNSVQSYIAIGLVTMVSLLFVDKIISFIFNRGDDQGMEESPHQRDAKPESLLTRFKVVWQGALIFVCFYAAELFIHILDKAIEKSNYFSIASLVFTVTATGGITYYCCAALQGGAKLTKVAIGPITAVNAVLILPLAYVISLFLYSLKFFDAQILVFVPLATLPIAFVGAGLPVASVQSVWNQGFFKSKLLVFFLVFILYNLLLFFAGIIIIVMVWDTEFVRRTGTPLPEFGLGDFLFGPLTTILWLSALSVTPFRQLLSKNWKMSDTEIQDNALRYVAKHGGRAGIVAEGDEADLKVAGAIETRVLNQRRISAAIRHLQFQNHLSDALAAGQAPLTEEVWWEEMFWQNIRDTNDAADIQLFVKSFPKGKFVSEARAALDRLATAQVINLAAVNKTRRDARSILFIVNLLACIIYGLFIVAPVVFAVILLLDGDLILGLVFGLIWVAALAFFGPVVLVTFRNLLVPAARREPISEGYRRIYRLIGSRCSPVDRCKGASRLFAKWYEEWK